MVKGGGHGNYRNLVLAPASVQEMAELTVLAFDLADKYRNPAIVLADGFVGQMMEPLDLEYHEIAAPEKPWAVKGTAETRKNLVSSIYLEPDDLEEHQRRMEAKYMRAQKAETRCEQYCTDDAELIVVGYDISLRVLRMPPPISNTISRREIPMGTSTRPVFSTRPASANTRKAANSKRCRPAVPRVAACPPTARHAGRLRIAG